MSKISRLKKFYKRGGGENLIKRYIKNHVLFYALRVFLLLPKNRVGLEQFREVVREKIYLKWKKRYAGFIENYECKNESFEKPKIIWFCWFQGLENAPEIVKKAYESIKKHNSEYEIRVITENNISQYVDIPDYIYEKKRNGIMMTAHFADILRLCLLEKYGGTWIDSTCIMSSHIPQDIENSKIFMFKNYKPASDALMSNIAVWFISSTKGNPVMTIAKEVLLAYWKKYNFICDYFFTSYVMEMIYDIKPELFKDMPKYPIETPHFTVFSLAENFTKEKFESYSSQTFIHKLSYRLNPEEAKNVDRLYDILEKE